MENWLKKKEDTSDIVSSILKRNVEERRKRGFGLPIYSIDHDLDTSNAETLVIHGRNKEVSKTKCIDDGLDNRKTENMEVSEIKCIDSLDNKETENMTVSETKSIESDKENDECETVNTSCVDSDGNSSLAVSNVASRLLSNKAKINDKAFVDSNLSNNTFKDNNLVESTSRNSAVSSIAIVDSIFDADTQSDSLVEATNDNNLSESNKIESSFEPRHENLPNKFSDSRITSNSVCEHDNLESGDKNIKKSKSHFSKTNLVTGSLEPTNKKRKSDCSMHLVNSYDDGSRINDGSHIDESESEPDNDELSLQLSPTHECEKDSDAEARMSETNSVLVTSKARAHSNHANNTVTFTDDEFVSDYVPGSIYDLLL